MVKAQRIRTFKKKASTAQQRSASEARVQRKLAKLAARPPTADTEHPKLGRPFTGKRLIFQVKSGVHAAEKAAVLKWVVARGYESESDAIRKLIIAPAIAEFGTQVTRADIDAIESA